LTNVSPPVQ